MNVHLIGYARVSTTAQDLAQQREQLAAAGCGRVLGSFAGGGEILR